MNCKEKHVDLSKFSMPEELQIFKAKILQDIGWIEWAPKPKPKAKISYGKKGKRKSVEVKK